MKPQYPFHKNIILIVACIATFFYWGCDSIDTPSNPDVVVEYDTTVGGFFSGDQNQKFPDDIEPEPPYKVTYKGKNKNTISESVIDNLPDFSIDEFIFAYDEVISKFPNIDTSSNAFAMNVINIISKNTKSNLKSKENLKNNYAFQPNEAIDFPKLNKYEKILAIGYPEIAYLFYKDSKNAMAKTISLFGHNGYKDRSDAFRHSYWNWLMSKTCTTHNIISLYCDLAIVREFASAHEGADVNDDDKRMDLNNNMVGRRVFANNPKANESEAQTTLLNHKLLWLDEKQKNVTVGIDYLVYLSPNQSFTVFDSGPDYDDVYGLSFNLINLGITPKGQGRVFQLSQIVSGTHTLAITCILDGTKGGCGFSVVSSGALSIQSTQSTQQIVIKESQTHTLQMKFPVMSENKDK